MEKQKIIAAINSNDYQELLKVYHVHKVSGKHDAFFNAGNYLPGSIQFGMLLTRVKDILRKIDQSEALSTTKTPLAPPPTITVSKLSANKIKPEKTRPVIDHNPHVNRADLPENLQILFDTNGKLNSEFKSKHAVMVNSTDDAERKALVNEIATLENTMNENWKSIDAWYNNRSQAPAPPVATSDPVTEAKKIEAAKRYIDRYHESKKDHVIAEVQRRVEYLSGIGIKNYKPRKGSKK